jgi:glycosyltransferase involved in cell wall biosynthesis
MKMETDSQRVTGQLPADGSKGPGKLRVGFGILAWNEASSIGATLQSLTEQSVARPGATGIERLQFAVVVNGSTDGTADRAREEIAAIQVAGSVGAQVVFEVHELQMANRQAAWNHFVHEAALPAADYLGMMDADIVLASPQTLAALIAGLESQPRTMLAGARAIKDVSLAPRRGWRAMVSATAVKLEHRARKPCIAGGLYLARADFLKRIWAPYGLCSDDAMFTFLAWTNFLTEPIDPNRIAQCGDEAGFVFEAYEKFKDLWRQHRRREIGRMMRHLVATEFDANRARYPDAASMMAERFAENPHWLIELARSRVKQKGWRAMAWRPDRITQLAYQPIPKAVVLSPVAFAFAGWSLLTSFAAYRTLKTQPISAVWKKDGNQRLVSPRTVGKGVAANEPRYHAASLNGPPSVASPLQESKT